MPSHHMQALTALIIYNAISTRTRIAARSAQQNCTASEHFVWRSIQTRHCAAVAVSYRIALTLYQCPIQASVLCLRTLQSTTAEQCNSEKYRLVSPMNHANKNRQRQTVLCDEIAHRVHHSTLHEPCQIARAAWRQQGDETHAEIELLERSAYAWRAHSH